MKDNRETINKLVQEKAQLCRTLHEIVEEWAGAEIGMPVYAQEAYYLDGVSGGGMNSGAGWFSPSGVRLTGIQTLNTTDE